MDDETDQNIVYKGTEPGTILGDLLGEGCPRRGKVRGAGERVCDASEVRGEGWL